VTGMATNIIRVGNVEIMALSDGLLEFDLCNFFPTIPEQNWEPHEAHLHDHRVRSRRSATGRPASSRRRERVEPGARLEIRRLQRW